MKTNQTLFPREIRFIKLLELIDAKKPITVSRLSTELGISERQVLRDIKMLRGYYDICFDRNKKTYYIYDYSNYEYGKIAMSKEEIISLMMGEKIISKCKGTPYEKSVKTAMERIKLNLASKKQDEFDDFKEYFYIDFIQGKDYTMKSSLFDNLLEAMRNRDTVKIIYRKAGRDETTKREVSPYGFIHSLGIWYFIGFCNERKGIRTFAIERVLQMEKTNKKFTRPDDFNLENYLRKSWHIIDEEVVEVKIKFHPDVAYIISSQSHHPSQKLEFNQDKSVIATYKVAGTEEIKRWILSFGCQAEVLSPEGLRHQIKQNLKQMKKIYSI